MKKNARIMHLYKGKGNKSIYEIYRGISLLSSASKILVILKRLNSHLLDETVPESQCGFRKNRGIAARQIQEKSKGQSRDLHIPFVDLTKAFDTVSRPRLWNIRLPIWNPPQDGKNNQMLSR